MKILHINNFHHKAGGTEIYIDRVSRQLVNLGHHVSVLYGVPPPFNTEITSYRGIFVPDIHISDDYKIIYSTIEIIKNENFDIAYLHNIFNMTLIEKVLKIMPTLKFVHDHSFYCPGGAKYLSAVKRICPFPYHPLRCFLMAYLTNCVSRHPIRLVKRIFQCGNILSLREDFDGIVVFSQVMKKYLNDNKINNKEIAVMSYFPGLISLRAKKRDTSMLLYVGRISREKGVNYLLRAVSGLEIDCKLVIVGDGYYLPYIKKLADRLGIAKRIEFTGWLTENELNYYYNVASVLVFPSLWPEPFGISGIEAMAHGLPVIAFNSGAVSEWLIEKETGFLVETGDIIGMRKKIKLLLQDTQLASDMGAKGKMRVEKYFTIESHVSHLLTVTSKAMKRYYTRMEN